MEAQALRTGTLGTRARSRIRQSELYDDLMLRNELDRRGRVPGAAVCELNEVLDYIRGLATGET